MKPKLLLLALGALACAPLALAGRGGGGGHAVSRPAGGGGHAISRPSGGGGSGSYRPSGGSYQVPHPSSGGSRLPAQLPAQRPNIQPQRPTGSSGLSDLRDPNAQRPQNRPTTLPAQRPQNNNDFIGLRPDATRPDFNRPATLPANHPTFADNHPNLGGNHPNLDNRPGQQPRPARPERPERWQNVQNNNDNQWNQWRQNNHTTINNFQVNRTTNWNSINNRYRQPGWATRYGSPDYVRWRGDVRNFRIGRGWEVWGARQPFWNNCFDNHWWGSCWWRPRPLVPFGVNVSPWWWWRPFAWTSVGVFFGSTIAAQPIVYDPGTTVIYEGDTYYVSGQPAGSATEGRDAARILATPEVTETPVPDPAMEGQPEQWLPAGVWALTQQAQGDATMFVQLSIDKDGLVAGAYKNIMTGEELPVIGRLDKQSQRVAWHFGNITQTIYETGLANLQNDVASIFVHFGDSQTQTWLLVRLPSPELPPGTVTLPEIAGP